MHYKITPVRTVTSPAMGWFPCAEALADSYEVDAPGLFATFSTRAKAVSAARRALSNARRAPRG